MNRTINTLHADGTKNVLAFCVDAIINLLLIVMRVIIIDQRFQEWVISSSIESMLIQLVYNSKFI